MPSLPALHMRPTLHMRLAGGASSFAAGASDPGVLAELLPVLPTVASEMLPELSRRLLSRVSARLVRELYV